METKDIILELRSKHGLSQDELAEKAGWNDFIILALTMLSNFILEYLFCKFIVYRGKEDTLKK